MAGAPALKVFNPQGDYVASCKHYEDAACLAGMYGEGAVIKYQHRHVIWREGFEGYSAAESYDGAGETMRERVNALWRR